MGKLTDDLADCTWGNWDQVLDVRDQTDVEIEVGYCVDFNEKTSVHKSVVGEGLAPPKSVRTAELQSAPFAALATYVKVNCAETVLVSDITTNNAQFRVAT
jgi:hypothetical protein